ncbi:MAG: glycosyltransferase [Bacteroides sp.]|nr:glycosyltransferase [Tannerellaceae bacterium]MCD8181741.1 glycosyltransferase [Bacteroides sp.]
MYEIFICDNKNVEQLKARIFEIPGYNGFLLSQYTLSVEDFYYIGKEIAIFTNVEELVKSIHYFLVHDIQRETIRKQDFTGLRIILTQIIFNLFWNK